MGITPREVLVQMELLVQMEQTAQPEHPSMEIILFPKLVQMVQMAMAALEAVAELEDKDIGIPLV